MSNKKAQIEALKERLMEGMQALDRGDMDAYERNLPPLLPDRHPDRDFFVCDILDAAPKDDLGSMEHPMFNLATKPDHRIRRYEHNGNTMTIAPGAHGLATIWDKDILIYCISQIVEAMNRGRNDVSKTVWVTAHDLLVSTNRGIDGRGYQQLRSALERLRGTSITTNIVTNGVRVQEGFGLIDRWKIVEESEKGRMIAVEITLSDWLYNAIQGKEVLTLNRDYFRLRKGLERRIYELARKHCGKQPSWIISIDLLHKKTGSSGNLKEFKRKIRAITETNHLPDYSCMYQAEQGRVIFYSRAAKGHLKQAGDLLQGKLF